MNKFVVLLLATAWFAGAAEPALKFSLLANNILCVRATRIPDNFAEQFQSTRPTNKLTGVVLDLRFAGGDQTTSNKEFSLDQKLPLVILVNGETTAGAAKLAMELRTDGRGIIIGSTNVSGPVTPDIALALNRAAEKRFQQDPFAQPPEKPDGSATTNNANNDLLPFVDHTSEAELVSKRAKDGELDEPDIPRAGPTQPVIRDPELARAVDLLKALAILHPAHG